MMRKKFTLCTMTFSTTYVIYNEEVFEQIAANQQIVKLVPENRPMSRKETLYRSLIGVPLGRTFGECPEVEMYIEGTKVTRRKQQELRRKLISETRKQTKARINRARDFNCW